MGNVFLNLNSKLDIWTDMSKLYLFYVSEINTFIHSIETFPLSECYIRLSTEVYFLDQTWTRLSDSLQPWHACRCRNIHILFATL